MTAQTGYTGVDFSRGMVPVASTSPPRRPGGRVGNRNAARKGDKCKNGHTITPGDAYCKGCMQDYNAKAKRTTQEFRAAAQAAGYTGKGKR